MNRFLAFLRSFRRKNNAPEFSHADVVAAGAIEEPISLDYTQSLNVLDNVVRDCIHVSKMHAGVPSPTGRHFYASVLFTALISRSVSLLILAPHTPWASKLVEHWDYSSAAIIVRTMIEIRAAFHYLCVDECTEDEWQCRWNLLNLHDCVSRVRLFAESPHPDAEQLAALRIQADELRERLKSNQHFKSLRNQKHLLNGQTAYLYPIEDLIGKANFDKATYRYLNILFSSSVHGLPMSYYRMAEQERGRGLPSPVERGYTSICLSLASVLLTGTRDDLKELFKDVPLDNKARQAD